MKAILRVRTAKNSDGEIILATDETEMVDVDIITFSDDETMNDYISLYPYHINQIYTITETTINSKRKV